MNEGIFDWIFYSDYIYEIPHIHLRKTRTFPGANAKDEAYLFILHIPFLHVNE
jgi:hypothetical protein